MVLLKHHQGACHLSRLSLILLLELKHYSEVCSEHLVRWYSYSTAVDCLQWAPSLFLFFLGINTLIFQTFLYPWKRFWMTLYCTYESDINEHTENALFSPSALSNHSVRVAAPGVKQKYILHRAENGLNIARLLLFMNYEKSFTQHWLDASI